MNQVENGLPVFHGSRVQKGHGLGNLLSGLVRSAVPLFKIGARALGKKALKTGIQIADDVNAGKDDKESIKSRMQRSGQELVQRTVESIKPPGVLHGIGSASKPIKQKRKNAHVHSANIKRVKHNDIFD